MKILPYEPKKTKMASTAINRAFGQMIIRIANPPPSIDVDRQIDLCLKEFVSKIKKISGSMEKTI